MLRQILITIVFGVLITSSQETMAMGFPGFGIPACGLRQMCSPIKGQSCKIISQGVKPGKKSSSIYWFISEQRTCSKGCVQRCQALDNQIRSSCKKMVQKCKTLYKKKKQLCFRALHKLCQKRCQKASVHKTTCLQNCKERQCLGRGGFLTRIHVACPLNIKKCHAIAKKRKEQCKLRCCKGKAIRKLCTQKFTRDCNIQCVQAPCPRCLSSCIGPLTCKSVSLQTTKPSKKNKPKKRSGK